jgi:sensor histidine kinase YesM
MTRFRFIIICSILTTIFIPGYFVIYYLLTEHKVYLTEVLRGTIFTLIATVSIGIANTITIQYLQKKFPWQRENFKRFLVELAATSFNSTIIISIVVELFYIIFKDYDFSGYSKGVVFFINIVIALIVNTIAVSIYEGVSIFNQWKKTLLDTEQLKREKIESQYMALKNQVNPHFLFNSLNSLSSLIRVSPDKAIEFVDKFSKIYRYVLDVSDKMVVELHEELAFLQSYFFLQKIRFGENLNVEENIEVERLNDFILPLSIQILIENTIKHNEVSSEHPLKISLTIENNFLVISNNLQQKINMEDSNEIGLANLTERYKHFTDKAPEFYATQNQYIAKIPLLRENE